MKNYNQQYNYAHPDSFSMRIANRARRAMFARFMANFTPNFDHTVLDVGVTADQSYASSNYFEALYPFKSKITACGLDDAHFLEIQYPGVTFQFADALNLPFDDQSYDFVHSSAVWEHVGDDKKQRRMLAECLRVARCGVMLTTPNRWFPIEFHCQLPLVHWLPKPIFRSILQRTPYRDLASEVVLNLLTPAEIKQMTKFYSGWDFKIEYYRLMYWPSNILLIGIKSSYT